MAMSGKDAKDRAERDAIDAVGSAITNLNDAIRQAMALKVRVEVGTVTGGGYDSPKAAQGWAELWTKDGIAVRFTRTEIAVAPAPAPAPVDGDPSIRPVD